MASIIVEVVLLVLGVVGINASIDDAIIEQTAQDVTGAVQRSSALQKAVQELKETFASANASNYDKSKAIFHLIKECETADILWMVIKDLCSNMRRLEWIKTAAEVTATLIAVLGTDGAALIAKIALALNSAYEYNKKLSNLSELSAMKT